jgi:hypothetical protein
VQVKFDGEGFSQRYVSVSADTPEEAKQLALDEYKKHIVVVGEPQEDKR